jgi:hypothetical protein
MIIQRKTLIGGHLVGIGKIKKDGSMEYHEVDIHNMITKDGLNTFFKYNNSNSAVRELDYSSAFRNISPWFCLEYCAYGTGSDVNDFVNTTDLTSQQAIYNTTLTDWPYTGSRVAGTNQFKFRVSHQSTAAGSSVDIKELGWKKKVGTNTYKLFSRVLLPSAYHLEAGEQLVTTYEVLLTFPLMNGLTYVQNSLFTDSNGAALDLHLKQFAFIQDPFVATGLNRANIPYIDERRVFDYSLIGSNYTWNGENAAAPVLLGPYDKRPAADTSKLYLDALYYSTDSNIAFQSAVAPYTSSNYDLGVAHTATQIQDYVDDTFHREIKVTVPAMWPKMSNAADYTDIYLINFRGLNIIFGHFDENQEFVKTPWRKQANTSYTLTFSHVFMTQDAEDWLAQQ